MEEELDELYKSHDDMAKVLNSNISLIEDLRNSLELVETEDESGEQDESGTKESQNSTEG